MEACCPVKAARTAIIVHPAFLHQLSEPPLAPEGAHWGSLPAELVHRVCSQLDTARDLLNFRAVSKECRDAAADDLLWKPLCQRHFSVPDHAAPDSWLDLYRFNHRVFMDLFVKGCMDEVVGGLAGPIQLPNQALLF